jgi:hypothetical protein
MDSECSTVIEPRNDTSLAFPLKLVENVMKLSRKVGYGCYLVSIVVLFDRRCIVCVFSRHDGEVEESEE